MTNRLTLTWAVESDPIHGTRLVSDWVEDREQNLRQWIDGPAVHLPTGPIDAVPWLLIHAGAEPGSVESGRFIHDELPAPLDFGAYAFQDADDPRTA